MTDEKLIDLYHKIKCSCVSEPEVVIYQYGNIAVCRDKNGEPISNESALEILTKQLETHKRLLEVKRELE